MSLAPIDSVGQEREGRSEDWAHQFGSLADQHTGLDRRGAMHAAREDIDPLSVVADSYSVTSAACQVR
jgi:hypothetical protein